MFCPGRRNPLARITSSAWNENVQGPPVRPLCEAAYRAVVGSMSESVALEINSEVAWSENIRPCQMRRMFAHVKAAPDDTM